MLSSTESKTIKEFTECLNHTILYKLNENDEPVAYPLKFINKWDEYHVRLPCCSLSFYPVVNNYKKSLIPRWQVIEQSLRQVAINVYDVQRSILSYNAKFETEWNFTTLIELFENELSEEYKGNFFTKTYPGMVRLALNLPNLVTKPIPLLKTNKLHSISLSQMQIASLLANAFFCTYPRRNKLDTTSEYRRYPIIGIAGKNVVHFIVNQCIEPFYMGVSITRLEAKWDFEINKFLLLDSNGIFITSTTKSVSNKNKIEKLKCILHYFTRVIEKFPVGIVTFTRRFIDQSDQISWENSDQTFAEISLQADSENSIFGSGIDSIKIDFANKSVGGGALNHGCVQEEILFVTQPELIVSRLFTETLEDHESLLVQGTELFCFHKGYAHNFEFDGDFNETEFCLSKRDEYGRLKNVISMIDALYFNDCSQQFTESKMLRDLNKAYCGFSNLMPFDDSLPPTISTGNWGCGAFGGDVYLKFVLQLIACAQLKKNIIYYTFGDRFFENEIVDLFKFLRDSKCTVGHLWQCLIDYNQNLKTFKLFEFIKNSFVK